ncbi:MAG: methylmalonyl Co-A mutase-associated GTPase MeaB [Hyphomicrobiaceae bacterium]
MPSINASGDSAIEELLTRLAQAERRAIARCLTEVEATTPPKNSFIRALARKVTGRAVIGITGPPGAGKSSLANALAKTWRQTNRTVGILAVDPSSPHSRGSILGDRVRMSTALQDCGVFVRSLASNGHLGGLTPTAIRMIDVFDAAGFDRIVLETVGTGQSEIDVFEVTDVRIVVIPPGLGDDIQAIKSGLLEIADIIVISKADQPEADATAQQLAGAVSLRSDESSKPQIAIVSVLSEKGIKDLSSKIDKLTAATDATTLQARRKRRARYLVTKIAMKRVQERIARDTESGETENLVDAILDGTSTPEDAVETILERLLTETSSPHSP